jgi:hypothetical protein
LSPKGGNAPTGKIADAINASFGSFDEFKKKFQEEAINHFGSGWVWLVRDDNNKLEIVGAHDAGNPLTQGKTPVLTCDVWGMYYIFYYAMQLCSSFLRTYFGLTFVPSQNTLTTLTTATTAPSTSKLSGTSSTGSSPLPTLSNASNNYSYFLPPSAAQKVFFF